MSDEWLKGVLQRPELSKTDKVLLCIAAGDGAPKGVAKIRADAARLGLSAMSKWNVSGLLSASGGKAIRTTHGWELGPEGRKKVLMLKGLLGGGQVAAPATELREVASRLSNKDVRAFVMEAVGCFEAGHLRAAAVLAWVGGMACMYDFVVGSRLGEFNAAAQKRDPLWKLATNADGLARMKESQFLQVMEDIGELGKSAKLQLGGALDLRNACGHPNSLGVGPAMVAAQVELLIKNVFKKFA